MIVITIIGYPRALLTFTTYPQWKTFFEELGCQVVFSSCTNKSLLDKGVNRVVDEACLPVKIYYGHVIDLLEKNVNYIFLPRYVSVERKAYICPKFMGLPDMLKANIKELPKVLIPNIDLSKKDKLWQEVYSIGKIFSSNPIQIRRAWNLGKEKQREFNQLLLQGELPHYIMDGKKFKFNTSPKMHVVLLGHAYNTYDSFINMGIIEKLEQNGVGVYTPEMLSQEQVDREVENLPKKLFWTFGKQMLGSAFYFSRKPEVKGMINITSFGCGPDSIIGNMVERYLRLNTDIPLLNLTIDEHTGEAGINTRIEAFCDMLERRNRLSENDISSHG